MEFNKKLVKIGVPAVLLLATIYLTLPLMVDRLIIGHIHEAWRETNVKPLSKDFYRHLDEFNKDSLILKPLLAFMNTPQVKDAGPYLNPRISWDFSDQNSDHKKKWESKAPLSQKFFTSEELNTVVRNAQEKFLELEPAQFANVDTEWLTKLREYDHWDIDKNSPVEFYQRVFYDTPFPKFDNQSPKIHLIKHLKSNDEEYAQALLDVLHFAKLTFSTETLVGEMIFVSILGSAKIAADARPSVNGKLGQWSALLNEKPRLKRSLWAINQFTHPSLGANLETMKKVYLDHNASTGLCASIREATLGGWLLWSAASDAMPVEYEAFKNLTTNHPNGCRLTWLKEKTPPWVRLSTDPASLYTSGQAFQFANTVGDSSPTVLSKIVNFFSRAVHNMPNTRKFVGTILLSIATPTFTSEYEKNLASETPKTK